MRSSSRRPAMPGAVPGGVPLGESAASHSVRNSSTSPSMASTTSSSTPQVGRRGEEKTAETVVGLQPHVAGEGAQAGPTGPVVEVVQGLGEVPRRPGRQVRTGESCRWHRLVSSILVAAAGCPWPVCAPISVQFRPVPSTTPLRIDGGDPPPRKDRNHEHHHHHTPHRTLTALASLVLVGGGMLTSAATADQETGDAGSSATAPDPDIDVRVTQEKTAMAAYWVEQGLFGDLARGTAQVGARTT